MWITFKNKKQKKLKRKKTRKYGKNIDNKIKIMYNLYC